jgi:hypothetical protein
MSLGIGVNYKLKLWALDCFPPQFLMKLNAGTQRSKATGVAMTERVRNDGGFYWGLGLLRFARNDGAGLQ